MGGVDDPRLEGGASRKCAHPLCPVWKWQPGQEDLACAHHSQIPDGDGVGPPPPPLLPRTFVSLTTQPNADHSPPDPT